MEAVLQCAEARHSPESSLRGSSLGVETVHRALHIGVGRVCMTADFVEVWQAGQVVRQRGRNARERERELCVRLMIVLTHDMSGRRVPCLCVV